MGSVNEQAVSLRFARLPIPPDGPINIDCLNCETPIEIHQPDSELPERMLGTCENCRTWYLVECDPNTGQAVLIQIPDPDLFLGLLDGQD